MCTATIDPLFDGPGHPEQAVLSSLHQTRQFSLDFLQLSSDDGIPSYLLPLSRPLFARLVADAEQFLFSKLRSLEKTDDVADASTGLLS